MRTRTNSRDSGSERTCIVSGAKGAPQTMLRFALAPDNSVVPDIRCILPGRGAWTQLSAEMVRRAADKQAFSRAFRVPAVASATLAGDVDALLERNVLQSLSMANKAGLVVTGAYKVEFVDRKRRCGRFDSSERRRFGRCAKACPGAPREVRNDSRNDPVHLSFLVAPIGFGVGEGKCDTCCAQIRRGDFCLSHKGGTAAPLSRERSGHDNLNQWRRAGPRRRRAWPAGWIG